MIRESPSCGGRSVAGNTGAVFLLRRHKLFQQISDVDGQLREDAYRDIICKWKNRGRCIFFVPVHGGALFCRINDPVFPDTGPGVQSVLGGIIHPAAPYHRAGRRSVPPGGLQRDSNSLLKCICVLLVMALIHVLSLKV